jgi:hypothetical protein
LGLGREANNITPEKKALFRNIIEVKNGLNFWSDTGGGYVRTEETTGRWS